MPWCRLFCLCNYHLPQYNVLTSMACSVYFIYLKKVEKNEINSYEDAEQMFKYIWCVSVFAHRGVFFLYAHRSFIVYTILILILLCSFRFSMGFSDGFVLGKIQQKEEILKYVSHAKLRGYLFVWRWHGLH